MWVDIVRNEKFNYKIYSVLKSNYVNWMATNLINAPKQNEGKFTVIWQFVIYNCECIIHISLSRLIYIYIYIYDIRYIYRSNYTGFALSFSSFLITAFLLQLYLSANDDDAVFTLRNYNDG